MSFESPNLSSEEKSQNRKLLDRLEKIKTRLENQESDKSDEVESIKEKIKSVQAELQQSAEPEQSTMTNKEYEKELEQSEDIKSTEETKPPPEEEVPDDVKARAESVRRVLGSRIDEETAEKLLDDLSKSEQEQLLKVIRDEDEGNEAVGLEESFIDISSENIISSLSKKQVKLIRRYPDLFTELNQAQTPGERSDIFDRYQKAQGFSKHDSDQRGLYDLVVQLKEKYS